jgi:hypothetical protein
MLFGSRYPGVLHQLQALSLAVKQYRPWAMGRAASVTSPDNLPEVTMTSLLRKL